MSRVTLICTVHKEAGLANVTELHAILARVQPDVIFLEVPAAAFADYYENCSRANLESEAVRKYCDGRRVRLVPVDLPTPERAFFEKTDHMLKRAWDTSSEYRQLMQSDTAYARMHGYHYLNSEYCSSVRSDIDAELSSAIAAIGAPRLTEILNLWITTNSSREVAMMELILTFCRDQKFSQGAFLIGAAHRQSVIDRFKQQTDIDLISLEMEPVPIMDDASHV